MTRLYTRIICTAFCADIRFLCIGRYPIPVLPKEIPIPALTRYTPFLFQREITHYMETYPGIPLWKMLL